MCGRYALTTPADVLAKLLEITSGGALAGYAARYNLAPTQPAPVVRLVRDGSHRSLDMLRWGLVPFWADDPSIGSRMINARAESVADKPAFRRPFERRRCIVPADGFFEWRKLADRKQPYFIHRCDGAPTLFAGLWDRWRDDDAAEPLDTFTIITTRANEQLATLHDRMPVVLEPEDAEPWLDVEDPGRGRSLLRPAAPGVLAMHPVGTRVNKPEHDDPEILERIEEPPPAPRERQLGLFE